MNQRRFFGNDFFYKKFAYSASVKIRSRRNFVLNIGFGRSPTSVFEVGFVKSDSKTCELVPNRPACCDCKCENFLRKNNRPLQVELENGRSDLQNDFHVLEAS